MMKYEAIIAAPFGLVAISSIGERLVTELLPLPESGAYGLLGVGNDFKSMPANVKQAYEQISQYLQQAGYIVNLQPSTFGTAFQQRVWQAIAAIPVGETRTYSQLAEQIGSGPRAVANACGANPLPIIIPCHRVVAKHGLGGFMQGQQNGLLIKQWLLRHEGVNLDRFIQ